MGKPSRKLQCLGSFGGKGTVKSVNGIHPDPETGDVTIAIPDSGGNADEMEQLNALIETDMLPAVHDENSAILTDENGKIILRY